MLHPPTIRFDKLSRDAIAGGRREEERDAGDVDGLEVALDALLLDDLVDVRLVEDALAHEIAAAVSVDQARREHVDANVERAEFEREVAREADDAALGRD